MRNLLVLLCFCIAQVALLLAQPLAGPAKLRMESFEKVWGTVKEKHFDTNYAGVNWDEVRRKYQPQAAKAGSDDELYRILGAMLGELKQTHFGIVPPDVLPEGGGRAGSEGVCGFKFGFVQSDIVVTEVSRGSGAWDAGVRSGWLLLEVGGVPVDRKLEALNRSSISVNLKPLYRKRLVEAVLSGEPGSSVSCVFLDAKDRRREARILRHRENGEMSPPLGNFPPQYTEFESRTLPGNIGYIRFNIFVIPQMEKIRKAIRSHMGARGLIIDLRDNPGGVAGMAMGMGGLLMNQQTSLGTMRMRSGEIYFAVFPQDRVFLGPLVILVNHGSASTSEIFAAGLQDLKRARVVGQPTAGAALPSMFEKLPTGALFQFAFGDFRTPKGVMVEGRGVVPDVLVLPKREDWIAGRDTQLLEAIREVELTLEQSRKGAESVSTFVR